MALASVSAVNPTAEPWLGSAIPRRQTPGTHSMPRIPAIHRPAGDESLLTALARQRIGVDQPHVNLARSTGWVSASVHKPIDPRAPAVDQVFDALGAF
jgi:hypothetical protein